jgi:ectoine hydroxylase-related dioxygenase (phytanoyl-CoA dioxygenase family)
MRVIPGTHKGPVLTHKDTFAEDNILTRGQNVPGIDESDAVDIVLQPGQASCHHPRLVHGSRPNRSAQRRIGVALQSYIATHVRQAEGDSFAIPARGVDHYQYHEIIPRPQSDASKAGLALRDQVNDNYQEILYRDAEKVRNY